MDTTIRDCRIIQLPKIEDYRGNLSFLESEDHIPFKIEKAHLTYDVPGGQIRGGHAYKIQVEFIIALSGSFDVVVSDGFEEKVVSLNRSYYGLFIPHLIWRRMENFSTNSLALTLSSTKYNSDDYIRNIDYFVALKNAD